MTGQVSGAEPLGHDKPAIARRASFWWLLDVAGAALFAAGLALLVAGWGNAQSVYAGAGAIVLAGLLRAAVQAKALDVGMAAAVAEKAQLRAARLPVLFGTAFSRGRMAGEDAARAVDTIEAIEGLGARYRPLSRAARVAPLLVAGLVALASPVAAGIMLVTLLPFGLGMALAGTAARVSADRQLAAIGRLNGLFLDRLRALPEVRSFGAEDRVGRQLAMASDEVSQRTIALFRVAFVSGGILEFLAALSVALVAVYCGFSLLGELPFPPPEALGLAAAFFALAMAPEFYLPMRRLAAAYHDRQTGEAAMLALSDELPPLPAPLPPAPFAGLQLQAAEIAYENGVSVGPVSLVVPERGLVVIHGPTGSGKSSLLAAVAGLRPLAGGALLWEAGAPAPAAWAGQRPLVLAGTIARNIALGRADATPAEIAAAAEAAGLAPLLASRPGGLEAMLDADGSGLSGGERRRLGIARALASARPLLLLDEPTADLDRATAAALIATLQALARTHALLVASHDPALIAAADAEVAL